jgi:hypothetical protein
MVFGPSAKLHPGGRHPQWVIVDDDGLDVHVYGGGALHAAPLLSAKSLSVPLSSMKPLTVSLASTTQLKLPLSGTSQARVFPFSGPKRAGIPVNPLPADEVLAVSPAVVIGGHDQTPATLVMPIPEDVSATESRQVRRLRSEDTLREAAWNIRRRNVTELPGTIFRRGLYLALTVLVASSALLAFAGGIALFGTASVFVILGVSILLDNLVSPRPMQDPRLGSLLVVTGLGVLLVAIVAVAT